MMQDNQSGYYQALATKDRRLDGLIFYGITTTGIYCRPICPARTPKQENCLYFSTATAAEKAGFRPCLRCRPECSPHSPAWRGTYTTVLRAVQLIANGALDNNSLESFSKRLGVSTRHLRRLFREHLGVSPLDFACTRRVQIAKQLITETDLPLSQVAFTAGYGSIRRFNAEFKKVYFHAPSHIKREPKGNSKNKHNKNLVLRTSYRPPIDWIHLIQFLKPRLFPYTEFIKDNIYYRVEEIDESTGVIEVKHDPESASLLIDIPPQFMNKVAIIINRVRNLFDLDTNPVVVENIISEDPLISDSVGANPGIRVPGAWNNFELAVQAIISEGVSLAYAKSLIGILTKTYGIKLLDVAGDYLPKKKKYLFPSTDKLIDADLESIGITRRRSNAIKALALKIYKEKDFLSSFESSEHGINSLQSINGIRPWVAQYIMMRAIHDPDAFPTLDIKVKHPLNYKDKLINAEHLSKISERWRPWRSYAAMHLWMVNENKI